MKEKFELLVTALIVMVVKIVDRLEAWAAKAREYLRENKDIQQGKKTWEDFWEHKKQNPGEWQNSDQDKALRNLLGWILCVVYVLMFVWGVVMVEFKRERQLDPARMYTPSVTRSSNSASTFGDQWHPSPSGPLKHVTVDGKTYEFEDTRGATASNLQDTQTDNSSAPVAQSVNSNPENQTTAAQQNPSNNVAPADNTAPPFAPSIRKTLEAEEIKDSMSRYSTNLPAANLPAVPGVNAPVPVQNIERTGGPIEALGSKH